MKDPLDDRAFRFTHRLAFGFAGFWVVYAVVMLLTGGDALHRIQAVVAVVLAVVYTVVGVRRRRRARAQDS